MIELKWEIPLMLTPEDPNDPLLEDVMQYLEDPMALLTFITNVKNTEAEGRPDVLGVFTFDDESLEAFNNDEADEEFGKVIVDTVKEFAENHNILLDDHTGWRMEQVSEKFFLIELKFNAV